MNNEYYFADVPLGFGMALAQNIEAMKVFSSLWNIKKQQIISHTHEIKSKKEMQEYVNNLSKYI